MSFDYDADGRRTSLTLPNGVTMSYNYDSASQLTGISYGSGDFGDSGAAVFLFLGF